MINRRGFTLIEAMVSTTITVVAGTALLYGVHSSIGNTNYALEQLIAGGLAGQMMDEIAGKKYCDDPTQPYQYPLGPNATEAAGPGRSKFDGINDFVNIRNSPPVDPWNIAIGADDGNGGTRSQSFRLDSYLARWRREVDVYYVSNTDLTTALPAGQTSNYRAVEVRIYVDDPNGARRLLTTLRRVFAYAPSS